MNQIKNLIKNKPKMKEKDINLFEQQMCEQMSTLYISCQNILLNNLSITLGQSIVLIQ